MAGTFATWQPEYAARGLATFPLRSDDRKRPAVGNYKGVYEIPLSGAAVEQRDPDAAAIRVKATLAGGTKSITYGAYLAPAV